MYNTEDEDTEILSTIEEAIDNECDIFIEYTNRYNNDSEGIITDIKYSPEYGEHYIDAWYEPISEYRTFKISRINSAELV